MTKYNDTLKIQAQTTTTNPIVGSNKLTCDVSERTQLITDYGIKYSLQSNKQTWPWEQYLDMGFGDINYTVSYNDTAYRRLNSGTVIIVANGTEISQKRITPSTSVASAGAYIGTPTKIMVGNSTTYLFRGSVYTYNNYTEAAIGFFSDYGYENHMASFNNGIWVDFSSTNGVYGSVTAYCLNNGTVTSSTLLSSFRGDIENHIVLISVNSDRSLVTFVLAEDDYPQAGSWYATTTISTNIPSNETLMYSGVFSQYWQGTAPSATTPLLDVYSMGFGNVSGYKKYFNIEEL